VSPVKYELGIYIPGDDILHSDAVKTSSLTNRLTVRSSSHSNTKEHQLNDLSLWGRLRNLF
jgi:hypothetical protein